MCLLNLGFSWAEQCSIAVPWQSSVCWWVPPAAGRRACWSTWPPENPPRPPASTSPPSLTTTQVSSSTAGRNANWGKNDFANPDTNLYPSDSWTPEQMRGYGCQHTKELMLFFFAFLSPISAWIGKLWKGSSKCSRKKLQNSLWTSFLLEPRRTWQKMRKARQHRAGTWRKLWTPKSISNALQFQVMMRSRNSSSTSLTFLRAETTKPFLCQTKNHQKQVQRVCHIFRRLMITEVTNR